jgi:hypothetical protein
VKGGDSDETVLEAGEQVVGAGRRRESLDERERGKEHGEYRFLSGDDHEDLLFLQMSPRGARVGSRRQLCDRRSSAALGVTD